MLSNQTVVDTPQLMLAVAICETCPADEADFIVPIMLNLFDTRTSLLGLLKMLVDREVTKAGALSLNYCSGCVLNSG